MLVVLRFLPSGLAMTPLAEMARSAKKRLESRPETREVIEKETSLVEARRTPSSRSVTCERPVSCARFG